MKRLLRRALADADVINATGYYLNNAPEYVHGFIDALQQAYQHIQLYPESGSLRYAQILDLPGLRVWKCQTYPYLIFYIEHQVHIEVWRVLHEKSDIPATLQINE